MWLGSGRVFLSYSGNQSSFLASLSLNEIIPSWHVPILTVHSSSLYRSVAWHLMFGLTPAGSECPLLSHGLKWLSASTGPAGSATTPSAPQPESEHSFLSEPSTPIISWRYELLNSLLPRKMTSHSPAPHCWPFGIDSGLSRFFSTSLGSPGLCFWPLQDISKTKPMSVKNMKGRWQQKEHLRGIWVNNEMKLGGKFFECFFSSLQHFFLIFNN